MDYLTAGVLRRKRCGRGSTDLWSNVLCRWVHPLIDQRGADFNFYATILCLAVGSVIALLHRLKVGATLNLQNARIDATLDEVIDHRLGALNGEVHAGMRRCRVGKIIKRAVAFDQHDVVVATNFFGDLIEHLAGLRRQLHVASGKEEPAANGRLLAGPDAGWIVIGADRALAGALAFCSILRAVANFPADHRLIDGIGALWISFVSEAAPDFADRHE